jgi:hypothetical protein
MKMTVKVILETELVEVLDRLSDLRRSDTRASVNKALLAVQEVKARLRALEEPGPKPCPHHPLRLYLSEEGAKDCERDLSVPLYVCTMYAPRDIYKGTGPLKVTASAWVCALCGEVYWSIEREDIEKGEENGKAEVSGLASQGC